MPTPKRELPETPIYRYRISFGKHDALRWTGHLDLQRVWERTFRRAKLPLLYSRGFHAHPRLVFAAPLPLGFTADQELLDVYLKAPTQPEALREQLQRSAPPGLQIANLQLVSPKEPAITRGVRAAEYQADMPAEQLSQLREAVRKLLVADRLPRSRRGKVYDLRPLVEQLELDEDTSVLRMQLACREGATGRPEEVLAQLGLDAADCAVKRTRLIFNSPSESSESSQPTN